MSEVFGKNCFAYYGVAGSAPTNIMSNITNVDVSFNQATIDVTTRAAGNYSENAAGMQDIEVSFQMIWDTEDLGFKAIKNAFMSKGKVALAFFVQSDGDGPIGDFMISSFSQSQAIDDVVRVDVTVKPARSNYRVTWVDSIGGSSSSSSSS